jgi:hypothetical protein
VQDKATTSYSVPGAQTAGTYFLRIAVGSGAQSSSLYTLRVDVAVGTWKPQGDVCGVNGCGRPASAGENLNVTWTGMSGITSLKLKITTVQAGGCPAGSASSLSPGGYANSFGSLPTTASGNAIFSNAPRGWYIFEFEAIAPGRPIYQDQRGVKVDCEILFAGQNGPEFSFTDGVKQTQSLMITLIPEPTIIPEPEVTPIP